MTTIVYKSPGILACDKMTTYDGMRYRCTSKMQQGRHYVYAIAGDLAVGVATVNWIEGDCDGQCPLNDDTVVVAMHKKTGRVVSWESPGVPIELEDKLYAIGSGGPIALGAIAAGASVEEAVKIAGAWDDGTGFGVQVVYSEKAEKQLAKERKAA